MRTLVPYFVPYVLYVAIGAAHEWIGPWADPLRTIVTAIALILFARQGHYPALRERPAAAHVLLGVLAGLTVALIWVPLAELVAPISETARTGLDPGHDLVLTVSRIAGMVLVVPFAEELLVRSALPRYIDSKLSEDWRQRPVGSFTPLSAAVSIGFFTFSHPEWLAALVTGIVWTALLAWTRTLRTVVLSHAVANAGLALYVLVSEDTRWW